MPLLLFSFFAAVAIISVLHTLRQEVLPVMLLSAMTTAVAVVVTASEEKRDKKGK